MTVKPSIAVRIKLLKECDKGADSVDTLCFEVAPDLVDDIMWWLAAQCENRVHVRVIARAANGHLTSEFFKIKLATFLGIVFIKESR